MDSESVSDDSEIAVISTSDDPAASEAVTVSLEDYILRLNLSGGQRNRIRRYLNDIDSNFQVMVKEAREMHNKIPCVIPKLESIKDNLDKWHRGTNVVIACGSAVSAVAFLFSLLLAPATAGVSLGVGVAATTAVIGGIGADGLKQHYSRKKGNNVVAEIEEHRKNAESAFEKVKENSERLRELLYELDPSLSLDENDVFQLSINFACCRLVKMGPIKQPGRLLRVSANTAIRPLQGLSVLSKGGTTTVKTANVIIRTATVKRSVAVATTKAIVKNPAIKNVAGITSTTVRHVSSATINQGTKVLKTATTVDRIGIAVIEVGDATVTKVSKLKAFITTTTKEIAPVLSKLGIALTAVGIVFDIYTAYKAFGELINDEKCNASKQITDHIKKLQELEEQVAQVFDYLQAFEDENNALEN